MKSRLVILTFIFIFAFSTIARADVIADRPGELSGTEATQISGGMLEIGGREMTEIGPVTTDAPQLTDVPEGPVIVLPEQKDAVIKAAQPSGEQEKTAVPETAAAETTEESTAAGMQLIDRPMPEAAAEEPSVEAPTEAPSEAPSEEAVTEEAKAEKTESTVTIGPVSSGPGSQRVTLGFGIVSPVHNMGSQNLAIGSVELADGSWQALGYEASIHAPYYKLIRETVDTMGTAWYVVKYSGNRIGNAHTNDGTKASEVWLLKSDCTAKTYIDIATANPTRGKIVAAALELLGCRYAYGGAGPDAFDCSGLVKYVFDKAGVKVPRTSSELCAMSGKVDISALRPGDICVRNGHAGIYIGNDVFIHASESSVGVVAEYLSSYNAINKFTTYINAVGD